MQPRLTMLDGEGCRRLHDASCSVLEKTGVRVLNPQALQLLRQAGALLDGDRVRIGRELVEHALESAPRSFELFERGSKAPRLRLDGAAVYFGPGSDTLRYLDPIDGSRREFRLKDVAACARLCEVLPQIDFVMSVGIPRDVPGGVYYRHQFAAMLRNSKKPIVFVCDNLADLEAIALMAAAAAGSAAVLEERPNLLLYSEPSSPLLHSEEATDKLLFCASHGIPVTHSPAPMMGGTAPVTIGGAVTLGNAEILSSLVMHQLQKPGAPFLYGHGVHHLDMKEMVSVYGAPEFQLARVMAAEMGRYYSLPVWGYAGHSDSKLPDAQAAADAQFSVLVALLARTNLNHDVGYLESGLTGSPEMMVLTDEIISLSRRFAEGVRVDDESLAVEVIDEVGPGGEFLSHDHTMSHWRALWIPQLFERMRLEKWEGGGGRQFEERLKEKTIVLMENAECEPLSAAAEREIEVVLKADRRGATGI